MLALAVNANAVQLITNGGFELPPPAGLTGWSVSSTNPLSFSGWYPDPTTTTPLNGLPTVGPHSGTGYAVTDQFGPGINALSQGYTVPVGTTSLTLTFDMFVNDWNSSTGTANVQALIFGRRRKSRDRRRDRPDHAGYIGERQPAQSLRGI